MGLHTDSLGLASCEFGPEIFFAYSVYTYTKVD